MLVASVGLLWRRNWARLAFIGLMSLGILWSLLALLLHAALSAGPGPVEGRRPVEAVEFAPVGENLVLPVLWLALTALFVWVLRRLLAPEIRTEFR